ncbi:MAG: hypothetical protein WBI17_06925 [Clostridiaceae bacterium]
MNKSIWQQPDQKFYTNNNVSKVNDKRNGASYANPYDYEIVIAYG